MKSVEEIFGDYLEGKISEAELEAFFVQNPTARQDFAELKQLFEELPQMQLPEVSVATDDRFYAFLEQEKGKRMLRLHWPQVLRYAAMILAVTGAYYLGSRNPGKEVVTLEKPVYITLRDTVRIKDEAQVSMAAEKSEVVMKELATIKKEVNQINDVQHKMILAMLRQESAASRLEAIHYSYNLEEADGQVMDALLLALEQDPSVNVRLAALEAVGRFELSPSMRENLVLSLAAQHDPALQMALITKLTELREMKALPVFASIMNNPNISENIRYRAEMGIEILNM